MYSTVGSPQARWSKFAQPNCSIFKMEFIHSSELPRRFQPRKPLAAHACMQRTDVFRVPSRLVGRLLEAYEECLLQFHRPSPQASDVRASEGSGPPFPGIAQLRQAVLFSDVAAPSLELLGLFRSRCWRRGWACAQHPLAACTGPTSLATPPGTPKRLHSHTAAPCKHPAVTRRS